MDKIFDNIKSLRVIRARNLETIGYWRCSSALDPTLFPERKDSDGNIEDFDNERSVRFMMRVGDGRCGEWTQFFTALCQTHGIQEIYQLPVKIKRDNRDYKTDTSYKSMIFLVKTWKISDNLHTKNITLTRNNIVSLI